MEDNNNNNNSMNTTCFNPYCDCCNAARGQVGHVMQQFLPLGEPLNLQQMPQTLPMVSYVYDIYGRIYSVINQAYPAPAMSLQDEHLMPTTSMPEQNYNAVNSELQNPSVSSNTESGQPLSTEGPVIQSPKLSEDTKANAASEKKTKKDTKRKPKSVSSVSDETKKRKRKTNDPTDDTNANAVGEKKTKKKKTNDPTDDTNANAVGEKKTKKRKTNDPTDDTNANAVGEKKTKMRKRKTNDPTDDTNANAVGEKKTKKRKRKTDDPADQSFAKKHCSELQQKLLESVNTFHALGKKPIVTSQQIREPEAQAKLQCPKPSSPKRGQVKAHTNLPKVKCEDVKNRSAPSLSKIAQNIQAETPIQKSPPRNIDMLDELHEQLEFSIPLPPEVSEALKRKAQQEREEACQYTAKGRVQYFKQWQRDMDISLYYGYI